MKPKLEHINLIPTEQAFPRRGGFGNKIKKFMSNANFKSMLTPLLSTFAHYTHTKTRIFFVIKFNEFYYSTDPMKTLKFLEAEIQQVYDPYTILASSDKSKIELINSKEKIFKYARGCITEINTVDNSKKVGIQLIEKLKENLEISNDVTIIFNENITDNKFKEINNNILKKDKSIKQLRSYLELRMSSYNMPRKNISSLESIEEIEHIYLKPLIVEEILSTHEENIFFKSSKFKINNDNSNLMPICIIDSGVNYTALGFNNLKDEKISDHGTKVASIIAFSEQLNNKNKIIYPEFLPISQTSSFNKEYDLINAIINAIITHSKYCKIFCLSQNFTSIDPFFRKTLSERLDRFIQKNNIILINSCGNIDLEDIDLNKNNYPNYISKFEVLCPSECRTILSVGNCNKTKNLPARNCRFGINQIFINKARDIFLYQKPEILFQGGDIQPESIIKTDLDISVKLTEDTSIKAINKHGDIQLDYGTSFAAPLVANAIGRLYKQYFTKFKNAETYKAMIFNKSNYSLIQNDIKKLSKPCFTLSNLNNIEYCNDGIYLQFEGEWNPVEQFETRDKKPYVKGYEVEFFIPKGISKFRIAIFHSNDYNLQKIDQPSVSFVTKVLKPSGKGINSGINTLAKPTHLHYATYKVSKFETNGKWKIKFKLWGYNVPKEELSKIKVRFGISIKLFLEDLTELEKLYSIVKNEGKLSTKSEIKQELIEMKKTDQEITT
jgi:hypothetical protein